jgi:hypothetical protein
MTTQEIFKLWLEKDVLFTQHIKNIANIIKRDGAIYIDDRVIFQEEEVGVFKEMAVCHVVYKNTNEPVLNNNPKLYGKKFPVGWCFRGDNPEGKNPFYIKHDKLHLYDGTVGSVINDSEIEQLKKNMIISQDSRYYKGSDYLEINIVIPLKTFLELFD